MKKLKSRSGFNIFELLFVVIFIEILAAVGQQKMSEESHGVKSITFKLENLAAGSDKKVFVLETPFVLTPSGERKEASYIFHKILPNGSTQREEIPADRYTSLFYENRQDAELIINFPDNLWDRSYELHIPRWTIKRDPFYEKGGGK